MQIKKYKQDLFLLPCALVLPKHDRSANGELYSDLFETSMDKNGKWEHANCTLNRKYKRQ